ncbi:hypothetical protein MP228_009893 [Amoeboaphelidium protococcarum]|nr:hypothetical protein MP228_009893 [Amoeboaphelidium protococcarum]
MMMMQTEQSRALMLVITFWMLMMMCTVVGGITSSRLRNFRLDYDDDDKPQGYQSYRDTSVQQEQMIRSADIQSPQVPADRQYQQQQRDVHSARQQSPQSVNHQGTRDTQEQSNAQAGVNHDYYCTAQGREEALTQFQSLAIAYVKIKNVELTDMEGVVSDMYEHIEMSNLSPIEKWTIAQRFNERLNLIITKEIKPEKSERLRVMKVQFIVKQQFRHIRIRLQPAALIAQFIVKQQFRHIRIRLQPAALIAQAQMGVRQE